MKTFGLKLSMIAHMMEMQDSMNTMIIGRDWVDSITHENVDFLAAMSAEAGEFPDHMGFKWWKKQEADVHQAKLELVDIFHFMISHIAQVNFGLLNAVNDRNGDSGFSLPELKSISLDNAVATVQLGMTRFIENSKCGEHIAEFHEMKEIDEKRKRLCRAVRRVVEMLEFDNISEAMKKEEGRRGISDIMAEAAEEFMVCCGLIEMSGKELYLNYVGKNVLNRFRQDNGYKDGSYVKIWNGREDNQVLEAFIVTQTKLDNDTTLDYEAAVYQHLQRHYPKNADAKAKSA